MKYTATDRLFPFCIRKTENAGDVGTGTQYPVGLTLEELVDFYYNKQYKLEIIGSIAFTSERDAQPPENESISLELEFRTGSGMSAGVAYDPYVPQVDDEFHEQNAQKGLACHRSGNAQFTVPGQLNSGTPFQYTSNHNTLLSGLPSIDIKNFEFISPSTFAFIDYTSIFCRLLTSGVVEYDGLYYPYILITASFSLLGAISFIELTASTVEVPSIPPLTEIGEVFLYGKSIKLYGPDEMTDWVNEATVTFDYSGIEFTLSEEASWGSM